MSDSLMHLIFINLYYLLCEQTHPLLRKSHTIQYKILAREKKKKKHFNLYLMKIKQISRSADMDCNNIDISTLTGSQRTNILIRIKC